MTIYVPNPLNDYTTYSYNIALYMINPTVTEAPKNIKNKILMADNSKMSNYNIQTVEQTNVVGNDIVRSTFANRFDITITEPNGSTFFSKILETAQLLGIPNHLKAAYIMEISFPARDKNNRPTRYPLVFRYHITFIDVAATIDQGGSQYVIMAYETATQAYSYLNEVKPSTVTFYGKTVGEVITAFETALNEAEYANWQMDPSSIYKNEYRISFDDDTNDWATWPIDSTSEIINTNLQQKNGEHIIFHYQAGTNITEFIGIILKSTKEYRQLPALEGGVIRDNPSENSTAKSSKVPYTYKVVGNVTNSKYDILKNDYSKIISYKIKRHIASTLIPDPSYNINSITNSSTQIERLKCISRAGLFKKKYEYLFTGKNTEVIGLDLKLNLTYYIMTPIAGGQIHAGRLAPNNGNNAQSIIDKVRNVKSKMSSAANGLRNTTDSDQQKTLGTILRTEAAALETILKVDITEEDIMASSSPIASFNCDNIDNKFGYGPETDTVGQSQLMIGAVNANIENSSDLLEIEINIKGDPYWLGKPNSFYGEEDDVSADFEKGGCLFYLRVNLPTPENAQGRRLVQPDYTLTGVYRVISVINQYRNGLFTQYLKAYRDLNIRPELVGKQLDSGYLTSGPIKPVTYKSEG